MSRVLRYIHSQHRANNDNEDEDVDDDKNDAKSTPRALFSNCIQSHDRPFGHLVITSLFCRIDCVWVKNIHTIEEIQHVRHGHMCCNNNNTVWPKILKVKLQAIAFRRAAGVFGNMYLRKKRCFRNNRNCITASLTLYSTFHVLSKVSKHSVEVSTAI